MYLHALFDRIDIVIRGIQIGEIIEEITYYSRQIDSRRQCEITNQSERILDVRRLSSVMCIYTYLIESRINGILGIRGRTRTFTYTYLYYYVQVLPTLLAKYTTYNMFQNKPPVSFIFYWLKLAKGKLLTRLKKIFFTHRLKCLA